MIIINKTTWSSYIKKSFPKLEKDLECDVLIVGGGICGILCGYYLERIGKKTIILEAEKICGKKTMKTTATITAIEDLMYSELIKEIGIEKAKLYIDANIFALNEYKKLASKFDFDFEECPSYKYSNFDDGLIEEEIEAIKTLGYSCNLKTKIGFPVEMEKALELENQGQMNPIKLVNNLINDLEIYEDSRVIKIKKDKAYTENNVVKFKDVIVSTGFPFMKFKGLFFMKMHQEKSHVIDVFSTVTFKGNGVGILDGDIYFRNYKDRILIGANDSKTGEDFDGFDHINNFISKNYNIKKIKHKWINIDAATVDKLPYIGLCSTFTENMYVATGFNMWGMTKSMIAAHMFCDIISGRNNVYEELFSPSRKIKISPLLSNVKTAFKGLLSFGKKRCKHLGCGLNYNHSDQTYECPCHGSKYDKDGNIIETPTQKRIKTK